MKIKFENFRIGNIRASWEAWRHPEVDIAVDFGTGNTLLCVVGKDGKPLNGYILDEPTVALTRPKEKEIISTGMEAKRQIGRDSADQKTMQPIVNGVIESYELAIAMLRRHLENLFEKHNLSPRTRINLIVAVPVGMTQVEERSVADVAISAGGKIESRFTRRPKNRVKTVMTIDQPLAAAIEAGYYDNGSDHCPMFIDKGGGTTQIAIMARTGIIAYCLIRGGGMADTKALQSFLRKSYQLAVPDNRAEELKIKLGAALPSEDKFADELHEVSGRDTITGYGKTVMVSQRGIAPAFSSGLLTLTEKIAVVCESAPEAFAADLADRDLGPGIILSGGATNLGNLDRFIKNETKLEVRKVDKPFEAVLLGAARVIADADLTKRFTKRPASSETLAEKKENAQGLRNRKKEAKEEFSPIGALLH